MSRLAGLEELLTAQQGVLLGLARQKGYLHLRDAGRVYATVERRRAAVRRLVELGFLRQSSLRPDCFDLVEEEGGA